MDRMKQEQARKLTDMQDQEREKTPVTPSWKAIKVPEKKGPWMYSGKTAAQVLGMNTSTFRGRAAALGVGVKATPEMRSSPWLYTAEEVQAVARYERQNKMIKGCGSADQLRAELDALDKGRR